MQINLNKQEFVEIYTEFWSCICAQSHFDSNHYLGYGRCGVENCNCLEFKQREFVLIIPIYSEDKNANSLQSLFKERRNLFPGF